MGTSYKIMPDNNRVREVLLFANRALAVLWCQSNGVAQSKIEPLYKVEKGAKS